MVQISARPWSPAFAWRFRLRPEQRRPPAPEPWITARPAKTRWITAKWIMPAAFGPYSMMREASGTAWQPDASPMIGVFGRRGGWTLMGFTLLNGVANRQSGRRGDEKAYLSGVAMGMATRRISPNDTIQLRAMVSPDAAMGARGYPLLLAAGETADGRTLLVDRQHPHDLFMELAVAANHRFAPDASLFVYAGLPGEPAFGPGTYMHRLSIMDVPEAPISHHWLDSTHIVFGVITTGVTWRGLKLEASRFKGREPDRQWALQASWAHQRSAEALEPGADVTRFSASAIHTRTIGSDGGFWSTTLAWAAKRKDEPGMRGRLDHALLLETGWVPNRRWRLFLRAEQIETDELFLDEDGHGGHGAHSEEAVTVRKLTGSVIRDARIARGLALGLGASVSASFVGRELAASYGGDRLGGMVFVRMRLG